LLRPLPHQGFMRKLQRACHALLLLVLCCAARRIRQCKHGSCVNSNASGDSITTREALRQAFERRYPRRNVRLSWEGDSGWVIRAINKVEKGNLVMVNRMDESMTDKLAFGLDEAGLTKMRRRVQKSEQDAFNTCVLALFLLIEKAKGRQSKWAEYIAILPNKFHLPAYFNDAEAACLTPTVRAIRKTHLARWDKVSEFAIQIINELPTIANQLPRGLPTEEELRWAESIWHTRSFNFFEMRALCPVLDMANHHDRRAISGGEAEIPAEHIQRLSEIGSATWQADMSSAHTQGTVLTIFNIAAVDIKPGDEVSNVYKFESMQRLFAEYGYVEMHPSLVEVESFNYNPAGSCASISRAPLCIVDANVTFDVVEPGFPNDTMLGLSCKKFHPYQSLQKALANCTNSASYTAPQAQNVLREALISTIETAEIDDARCQALKHGHFPLINTMRKATLSALRDALRALD